MIDQAQMDRLTSELASLRGSIVRHRPAMTERVDRLLLDTRRQRLASAGSVFEPQLRSVENLLACVRHGLLPQHELKRAG